jgi:hypothetical protein
VRLGGVDKRYPGTVCGEVLVTFAVLRRPKIQLLVLAGRYVLAVVLVNPSLVELTTLVVFPHVSYEKLVVTVGTGVPFKSHRVSTLWEVYGKYLNPGASAQLLLVGTGLADPE